MKNYDVKIVVVWIEAKDEAEAEEKAIEAIREGRGEFTFKVIK
jgi:hypothetical protein